MNFEKYDNTGRVMCFCLVKSVEKKTSVKGDTYLDFTLGDTTGEINAKLWNYSESEYGEYVAGDLIKVCGSKNLYKDVEQLRIEKIRHTMESDGVNAADFVKSAAYKPEDMYNELVKIAEGFSDNDLKNIVLAIYTDRKEQILYWPAAIKLHHALRGGLLMHTLSIVRLSEAASKVYPFIDRELLIAGAMLHDIAKIEEYSLNNAGVAEGDTVQGELLGHLTMGAEIVGKYAEKVGAREKTTVLLKHMIISHHGVPEFGAAVRPKIIEAEILSELDLMDARLFEMKDALLGTENGGFSGKVWALDNLKLYNHGRKQLNTEPELF